MKLTPRSRRLLALCFAALLGLSSVMIAEAASAAGIAYQHFRTARSAFDAEVGSALQAGFSSQDLASVTAVRALLEDRSQPVWVADRVSYYERLTRTAETARDELRVVEDKAMDTARQQSSAAVQQAHDKVAEDAKLGADPADLKPLQDSIGTLDRDAAAAQTLKDHKTVVAEAQNVTQRASDIGAAQAAENQAVLAAGRDLVARSGGVDGARNAARGMLPAARNEASLAAFLELTATVKPYSLLEKFAGMIDSPNADQATQGAGGVARYSQQLHDLLMSNMPRHTIVVSLTAQSLWAYDRGKVILNTVVTTGKPALPTDVGRMSVLWKVAPWTMHSPWPKESPYYYPDTKVRKVVWFTNSGEGFHDASWRTAYGPGTNLDGSHGCVNMPGTTVDALYDWAQPGDAVVVYPGDGGKPADQLKQETISDPTLANAPKGA